MKSTKVCVDGTDREPAATHATIAVAGDPAADYFHEVVLHPVERESSGKIEGSVGRENWRQQPGYQNHLIGGGVLLLGELIRHTADAANTIIAPRFDISATEPTTLRLAQSMANIASRTVDVKTDDGSVQKATGWWIDRFDGFAVPGAEDDIAGETAREHKERLEREAEQRYARGGIDELTPPTIAVFDDAGNGFRNNNAHWPKWILSAFPDGAPKVSILKINRPFPDTDDNALFRHFSSLKTELGVVVVNGYHLREVGIDIGRRLSWERTAADLARFVSSSTYVRLTNGGKLLLIVRFEVEGAAIIWKNRVELVVDSGDIEGDADVETRVYMPGTTSAFTAGFVAFTASGIDDAGFLDSMTGGDPTQRVAAVDHALTVARQFRDNGFTKERKGEAERLVIPFARLPRMAKGDAMNVIAPTRSVFCLAADGAAKPRTLLPWKPGMKPDARPEAAEELAFAMTVARGGPEMLRSRIHTSIGKLTIAHWREVETYRYAVNLVRKYLLDKYDRPLSLGVFGSPGSGKSFGVKQIAEMLNRAKSGMEIVPLEFNVAQWTEPRDLIAALHLVRDRAIAARMPLVFFDEFDCDFGGGAFGWLKYFLAPMQDGRFRDGSLEHAIGKAIFVFAGGTSPNYTAFAGRDEGEPSSNRKAHAAWAARAMAETKSAEKTAAADTTEEGEPASKARERALRFATAKGPDFISRLSGAIDIPSIEVAPDERDDEVGRAAVLRRALIIHQKFREQFGKIFTTEGEAAIDPTVLNALLRVAKYEHGVRSIEAILRMSSADGTSTSFSKAHLPNDDQLRLHVDVNAFRDLLRPERQAHSRATKAVMGSM